MQSRLMFATSTAIQPDILIVDEVLGAGDGYFIAKSRQRMERLVRGGCTMLLVSHSTSQVLEMCERAIWLDKGAIRMQDEAFRVVKAYEEFIHGSSKAFAPSEADSSLTKEASRLPRRYLPAEAPDQLMLQEPSFEPHRESVELPEMNAGESDAMKHPARGGISRWAAERGLKVCGFDVISASGSGNRLISMEPARITLHLEAEESADYSCRYGLLFTDPQGRALSKIYSPKDEFFLQQGERRKVSMTLNPLQLGSGDYIVSISVWEYGPLELINSAKRYDNLSRSFEFQVALPQSLAPIDCAFLHTAEWAFSPAQDDSDRTSSVKSATAGIEMNAAALPPISIESAADSGVLRK